LAFKVQTDPYVGKLTYLRVYSGTLEKGDTVVNTTRGMKKERLGRLLLMHANNREDLDTIRTGDIVAAVGLKQVTTGDTLSSIDQPIQLETLVFPEPVIHVAVEPKTKADQDKLGRALYSLSEEDPTFRVRTDEETGQTVISGMGELHLEVLVDRMQREFAVDANVGKPQVAYRETVRKTVTKVEEKYVRQTGGRGQYGHVVITLEPTGPGGGYEFVDEITGGVIPKEYIQPVNQGITEALTSGVLAGYPVVDVRVRLTYGFVPRRRLLGDGLQDRRFDSREEGRALSQPGVVGADHGRRGCDAEDYLGDVIGDLSSRRGRVEAWIRTAIVRRFGHLCRWPTCSATLLTCVLALKGERRTPCSSVITRKYLTRFRRRSWPRPLARKKLGDQRKQGPNRSRGGPKQTRRIHENPSLDRKLVPDNGKEEVRAH